MKIYKFGCAPEALQDGYGPSVQLFHGTEIELREKYQDQDVAAVIGARHAGSNDVFEFGILRRN